MSLLKGFSGLLQKADGLSDCVYSDESLPSRTERNLPVEFEKPERYFLKAGLKHFRRKRNNCQCIHVSVTIMPTTPATQMPTTPLAKGKERTSSHIEPLLCSKGKPERIYFYRLFSIARFQQIHTKLESKRVRPVFYGRSWTYRHAYLFLRQRDIGSTESYH